MKKWINPEIVSLDVNKTAHQWKPDWSSDGGYLGDGKLSGWFGPDPQPANNRPTTTVTDTVVPTTPVMPETAVVDVVDSQS